MQNFRSFGHRRCLDLTSLASDFLAFVSIVQVCQCCQCCCIRPEEGLFPQFGTILKEYKSQGIDLATLESRVKNVFKDYDNLLVGFNLFLQEEKKKETRDENQTRVSEFLNRVRVQISAGPSSKSIDSRFDDIKLLLHMLMVAYESAERKASELLKQIEEDNRENVPIELIKQKFSVQNLRCIVSGLKDKITGLKKHYSDFCSLRAGVMAEIQKKGSECLITASWLGKIKEMEDLIKKEHKMINAADSEGEKFSRELDLSKLKQSAGPSFSCLPKEKSIHSRLDDIKTLHDVLMIANQSAERKTSELLEQINADNHENDVPIDKQKKSAQDLNCNGRLFGSEGWRIINNLLGNPCKSFPHIVSGFKEKIAWLNKHYLDFNGVVEEIEQKGPESSITTASRIWKIEGMEEIMKKEYEAIFSFST